MGDEVKVEYADENQDYWEEYSPLQRAKHDLIRNYLGGWFPKLGSWAGRVLYVDTHAGRGRYANGEMGSPIVALKTLLNHPHRDRLLSKSEFIFWVIERDERNLASLRREIAFLKLPSKRIMVEAQAGNSLSVLRAVVASLREHKSRMAPAFIFLDPHGFKLPSSLLRELMDAGRVELLVTFMWRWVDMAIAQARNSTPGELQLATTLDALFDTSAWRSRITSDNSVERARQASELLREQIAARWFTDIKMLGENEAIRYLMLHFTNHNDGRDLMKHCIWKICPDGGLHVRMGNNPNQEFLIKPTPDLRPLSLWVQRLVSDRARRWSDLSQLLRSEIWREPHLRVTLKQLIDGGRIRCDGKFSRTGNPTFSEKT
jgi:three-Cys-motif partner protein